MTSYMQFNDVGGASSRIFANHAADYAEQGLYVFPVGGDTGKRPLVTNWREFKLNTWEDVADRFANDNIGFLNGEGENPVSIVDVDDPKLYHPAIEMFGYTPIIIETPNGGYHLWYGYSGEKRQIGFQGLKIDILGKGGLAVAPPSYRHNKGQYRFIEGDVTEIPNLPLMKLKTPLAQVEINTSDQGNRNNTLFDYCRLKAMNCFKEADLIEIALIYNKTVKPPLPDNEVLKVVASVWGYKVAGNLLIGGEGKMFFDIEYFSLSNNPDAFTLFLNLKLNHGARKTPFAIDHRKMKQLLGWGDRRRVAKAIDYLMYCGMLERVGIGGNLNRAYLYCLKI